MMDMFNNLWTRGGGTTAAPTNMSQIQVQQQPMDLAGTVGVANSQIDYGAANQAVMNQDNRWGNAGAAMAMAGASSLANMHGKQPQGLMAQSSKFQGAGLPDATNAEKLSAAKLSDMQQFAQAGGLLGAAS